MRAILALTVLDVTCHTLAAASIPKQPAGYTQRFHFNQEGVLITRSKLGRREQFHCEHRHLTVYRDNLGFAVAVGTSRGVDTEYEREWAFTHNMQTIVADFFRRTGTDMERKCYSGSVVNGKWVTHSFPLYEAFDVTRPFPIDDDEFETVRGGVWFGP